MSAPARHVPAGEVRKLRHAHAPQSELHARCDAIDARLRKLPDTHRTDVLATLPTATAAMLAVILPMLGVAVVLVVILVQVGLWCPVAYTVMRKL